MEHSDSDCVQFASIRILTEALEPLVRFYEVLAETSAQWLTDDFAEVVTPSATIAVSHRRRVSDIDDVDGVAGNDSVIYEFLVTDVERLFERLTRVLGASLVVVQPLTTMPWGNLSLIIRDPAGTLVNLYTPVTPDAVRLQQQRQPQPLA